MNKFGNSKDDNNGTSVDNDNEILTSLKEKEKKRDISKDDSEKQIGFSYSNYPEDYNPNLIHLFSIPKVNLDYEPLNHISNERYQNVKLDDKVEIPIQNKKRKGDPQIYSSPKKLKPNPVDPRPLIIKSNEILGKKTLPKCELTLFSIVKFYRFKKFAPIGQYISFYKDMQTRFVFPDNVYGGFMDYNMHVQFELPDNQIGIFLDYYQDLCESFGYTWPENFENFKKFVGQKGREIATIDCTKPARIIISLEEKVHKQAYVHFLVQNGFYLKSNDVNNWMREKNE